MKDVLRRVEGDYAAGLREYLAGGGEAALKRAYELGREALRDGIGLLEIVAIHHRAAADLLAEGSPRGDVASRLERAEAFVSEALSPFEMTHRGFRDANTALRRINERLEAETKRIAHALHDEVGPLLVSVHLDLKEIARGLDAPTAARIVAVRERLNETEEHLRHFSHELRPTVLDELGLAAGLHLLAEGVSARNGLRVVLEDVPADRLPPVVETALYRIVQEALTNVARHARASLAGVRIVASATRVDCSVHDDGVGFDAAAPPAGRRGAGLGLAGMRERLDALRGSLRIVSVPGRGTDLHVSIPLED